jgi:hypothetical protein
METIKIKVSKKILGKALSLLRQFDKNDLQVIQNELDFGFSEQDYKMSIRNLIQGKQKLIL